MKAAGKASLDLAVDGQIGGARFANTQARVVKLVRHLDWRGS